MPLTELDTETLLALIDSFESFDAPPPDLFSSVTLVSLGPKTPDRALESTPRVDSPVEQAATPLSTDEAIAIGQSKAAAASSQRLGKKRRKINPAYSSTVLQRRKRAEIEALREQVAELEARRSLLEGIRGTSKPTKHDAEATSCRDRSSGTAARRGEALHEFRERQRAEDTSAKLKTAASNQHKVSRALEALVTADSVVQVRPSSLTCRTGH
jgi:hypothetical protein